MTWARRVQITVEFKEEEGSLAVLQRRGLARCPVGMQGQSLVLKCMDIVGSLFNNAHAFRLPCSLQHFELESEQFNVTENKKSEYGAPEQMNLLQIAASLYKSGSIRHSQLCRPTLSTTSSR